MSEQQSPETVEDPFGTTEVASMEDILASIRSMIADDEAAPELAAPPPEPLPEPAPAVDTSVTEPMSGMEMDLVMETPAEVAPEPATEPATGTAGMVSTDSLDIDSLFDDDDILATDIPVTIPASNAKTPAEEPALATLAGSEDIDLVKSLMEELSTAPDAEVEPAVVDVPNSPETAPAIPETVEVEAVQVETSDTLDAVLELDETWFSGDLAIPEGFEEVAPTVATGAEPVQALDTDIPDTGSFLDDILDSTIASEEALNASEAPDSSTEPASSEDTSNVVSLAAIAARAEDDAEQLEAASVATDYPAPPAEDLPNVETPAEVELPKDIVAELLSEEPDSGPELDLEPAPAPQPAPESQADRIQALEEEVMARTAPLEEMIDDEVETEAHNAFAELNKLVEEKAVVEERGPRIGDLVQEALKPMLKEWLDENLKGIVERAVTKEVKRISSGK